MDIEVISYLVKVLGLLWQVPYGEYIVLSLPALYLLYVQIMRFKRRYERKGRLPWYAWIAVAALAVVGYPLDVFVNISFGSAYFLDVPRELTLSERLNRYTRAEKYHRTWRERHAEAAAPYLNAHDDGHIYLD